MPAFSDWGMEQQAALLTSVAKLFAHGWAGRSYAPHWQRLLDFVAGKNKTHNLRAQASMAKQKIIETLQAIPQLRELLPARGDLNECPGLLKWLANPIVATSTGAQSRSPKKIPSNTEGPTRADLDAAAAEDDAEAETHTADATFDRASEVAVEQGVVSVDIVRQYLRQIRKSNSLRQRKR